jgi:hypothetical protein
MPDPLQELLASGAVPTTAFPPTSRYAEVGVDAYDPGDGSPPVPFLRRRFCPRAERLALLYEVGVVDPRDLTDPVGRRLRVTLPEGVPGPSDAQ